MSLPNSPKERLVPTPSGKSFHYIGPSSSFGFVLTCRSFVQEYVKHLRLVQPNDPRLQLMEAFAESRWSKGLEPKVAEEKHTAPGPADLERAARVPINSHAISIMEGKFSDDSPLSLLLPSQDIASLLVDSFFERVHKSFLLFRRQSFQRRFDSMWSKANVPVHDFETGWLCSVLMVLILGAQALGTHDNIYLPLIPRYIEWVEERVYQLQYSSSLINIQALLLLQLYQHNSSERNKAFLMLGLASIMAMNLGMHREGDIKDLDPIEREVRRRVFWTIFVHNQNSCTILGRPCIIKSEEVSVSYPNEYILDGCECVPMGYVEQLVGLTKIMAETSKKMYPAIALESKGNKTRLARGLFSDLDDWKHRLPPHLALESLTSSPTHMRAISLLHLQFYLTQSLVGRPFVLRKVATQLARRLGKDVSSKELEEEELRFGSECGSYAKQGIILAHQLITSNQFDGLTWMDAYYVYHGVLIIALDTLAKDSLDTEEDTSRKNAVVDIKNAIDKVPLCPLFTMLTQVAFQLAEIAGIVENHASNAEAQQINLRNLQPNVQGIPDIDFLGNSQEGNIIEFFLQGEHVNIPWKVGPDSLMHSPQVSAPLMNPFMSRDVPIMDEQAVAATMATMPTIQGQMQPQQPQQPYGNWTGGYEVISPQTQYGNPQVGPSHNGNGHPHVQYGNQAGPSHILGNGNGNGNGNAHSQYANHHGGPSHSNGGNNGHAHAQYANAQVGSSHINGNGNGHHLNNYEMQRDN